MVTMKKDNKILKKKKTVNDEIQFRVIKDIKNTA